METVISRDSTQIGYERTGSGRPLVLVHGTTASRGRWSPVLPALAAEFTVVAMDRRGRGDSGDADRYAGEREYEDVAAVVNALGEPVSLLGHSFGAICALEAALLTNNIEKLILCEPPVAAPEMPVEIMARLQAMLDGGDREGVLSTFLREIAEVPADEIEKMSRTEAWPDRIAAAHTLLREIIAVGQYRFTAERFAEMKIETLLVLGGDSPPLYRDSLEQIDRALPYSKVVRLPGQQHVPMDTAPDLFAEEVLAFLRQ